jgi:iron complex outermembrane recepter protein
LAKIILLKKSVTAVALTLVSTQIALAQSEAPIQKVTVTGSNIKRLDAETATPLQIVRREEIQRLGVSSVKELLDTLTASTGSLSDLGGSNSFAGGASSASLRNLGKQSTLILLNSRRVAPYALADYNEVFTNLDSLPLDAVERIEVLRSGGSAVYGSDAVAGVINIITRANYRGLSAKVDDERSLKNGVFNSKRASITGGFGDLAVDKYNILANLELYERSAVIWRQVVDDINPAYGEKFGALRPDSGLSFGRRGAPSTFSYPGNLIGQGPVPGCAVTNTAGLCVFDRFSRFEAQPKAKRANLLISGNFNLGENLQGFSEILYSRTQTDYLNAFPLYDSTGSDDIVFDPVTNSSRPFSYRLLPSSHPLNHSGDDIALRYRFADAPSNRQSEASQYRFLAGLKGNWGKYDWEAAVGMMGSSSTDRSRGGMSESGFRAVIGDYRQVSQIVDENGVRQRVLDANFFNRDYKIGQANSAATLNQLFPVTGTDGKYNQTWIDGKLAGEIGKLDGRSIGLAVGADLRHERFEIKPTANLASGDIVANGASSADAGRSFGSVYSEINLPLAKNLEVQGAMRADKFPGFNTHISPKLAFRLEASPIVLFRGTVEGGFRAPNLTESAESTKFAFVTASDPKRCDKARALASDLLARSDALPDSDPNKAIFAARADSVDQSECSTGIANIARNNPNLKPETTRSFTLGMVLEPVKNVTLALDYWNIKRKDEIDIKSTDDLLAAESNQKPGVINRAPLTNDGTFSAAERAQYGVTAGKLISTAGQFENISQTKTSGVDLSAAARFKTAYGRLDLGLSTTYLIELRNFSETLGTFGDNLAGRYGSPRVVANLSASLQTGKFTNGLRWVYESATSLNTDFFDESYTGAGCAAKRWSNEECGIGHEFRLDYNFSYTGIKNTTITAFVRNITNRRPPLDLRSLDRSGSGVVPQSTNDVRGRSLRLTAEYKFF